MTTDVLMQVLQWLIPIGSLGTVAAWLVKRDTRKDRIAKEKNDIYKEMYDNISGTLIELQNENKRLYRAVRQLNQTIQKAMGCPHYAACPLRDELQKPERSEPDGYERQPAKHQKIRNGTTARAQKHCRDGDSYEPLDDAPPRGGL